MAGNRVAYIKAKQVNTKAAKYGTHPAPGVAQPDNYSRALNLTINPNNKNGIGNGIEPKNNVHKYEFKGSKLQGKKIFTTKMKDVVDQLNQSLNAPRGMYTDHNKLLERDATYYNRFKIPDPNGVLTRGFPHVFFVSPMCNIFGKKSGSTNQYDLLTQYTGDDLYQYIYKTAPQVLHDISRVNNKNHDFSFLLSNYVKSFSLSDEFIQSDTYGRGYTGWKISYGKHGIESKTAGDISIVFKDNRELDIYKLHKAWVEYIAGVYRGLYTPRDEDVFDKVLDYVGAIYYIVTAEDGEEIIFWSKYYGVYPADMPSSQYSWGGGNVITENDLTIKYNYSFKEDYNPFSLVEFNKNSHLGKVGKLKPYIPTFDSNIYGPTATYVKKPYIELVTENGQYKYMLRFTSVGKSGP